jgi:hypothetical protein
LGRWGFATSLEKRGLNQVSMGDIFNQVSPSTSLVKLPWEAGNLGETSLSPTLLKVPSLLSHLSLGTSWKGYKWMNVDVLVYFTACHLIYFISFFQLLLM